MVSRSRYRYLLPHSDTYLEGDSAATIDGARAGAIRIARARGCAIRVLDTEKPATIRGYATERGVWCWLKRCTHCESGCGRCSSGYVVDYAGAA